MKHLIPVWTMACVVLWAVVACAGQPSDDEQLWLQMTNRFRSSPAEELDRLVNYLEPGTGTTWAEPISPSPLVADAMEFFDVDPAELRRQFQALQPVPPLAWSESLHDSARYYSGVIIDRDEQSHSLDQYTGPMGLFDRLQKEGGYQFTGGGAAGENIFAFAQDVFSGHAAFVLDWGFTPTGIQDPPGHRDNLLSPLFRELGMAIVPEDNQATEVGPWVVTQHLAANFAQGPLLTGAVYQDRDEDDFYSPGEGLGDLQVQLRRVADETVSATAVTYHSGGLRLDLSGVSSGEYRVVLSDPEPVFWSGPLTIEANGENLSIDILDPQYDIDSLSRTLREQRSWSYFDLNADGLFTEQDRSFLIESVYNTYLGDANLDGEFNSGDLVDVLAAGQYEDDLLANSTWATGDFDGDREVTTADLIVALAAGGYERGPRAVAAAVPEPSAIELALLLFFCAGHRFAVQRQP